MLTFHHVLKPCQTFGLAVILAFFVIASSMVNELRGRKIKPIPKSLSKKQTIFFLLFIFVLGVLPRLLSLLWLYPSDDSYYIHVAWRMYSNYTLYDQISVGHPPASPIITSTLFKLFGVGVLQTRVIPVFFSVLSIPLVFITSRRFWGSKPAFYSTILFSISSTIIFLTSATLMYSELIFFSLLSAYLFLTGFGKSNFRKVFFSGVCAGIAILFRLFGLFLFAVGLIFMMIKPRQSNRELLLAYLAGLLLVVAPVFYYYYQTSPDSFPYFLFGFHYDKINSDVGFSTKVVRLLMNVSYYPSLVLYFLAVLSQKITKTKRYANNDADMFFALWALGVVAILFLPIQIDFSVNVYSAYFIPPFLFLAGSLVESLNIRQIRTIFVCILVIEAIATYALLLDGFYSYSDVKRISRFVSENSEVNDTITGSYITAFTVSFLSGRELTEDALGLTSFDLMRAAMSRKRCDNLSYRCEESARRLLMEGSKYVILTPQDDQTSPINEKSIEGENCLTLMKAGDISVYSCKKSNTTP